MLGTPSCAASNGPPVSSQSTVCCVYRTSLWKGKPSLVIQLPTGFFLHGDNLIHHLYCQIGCPHENLLLQSYMKKGKDAAGAASCTGLLCYI